MNGARLSDVFSSVKVHPKRNISGRLSKRGYRRRPSRDTLLISLQHQHFLKAWKMIGYFDMQAGFAQDNGIFRSQSR